MFLSIVLIFAFLYLGVRTIYEIIRLTFADDPDAYANSLSRRDGFYYSNGCSEKKSHLSSEELLALYMINRP